MREYKVSFTFTHYGADGESDSESGSIYVRAPDAVTAAFSAGGVLASGQSWDAWDIDARISAGVLVVTGVVEQP